MADVDPPSKGPGSEPDPFEQIFGGQLPPELREQLKAMGLDNIDPSMLQMAQAQMQAMMSAPSQGPVNTSLSRDTAVARVDQNGDPELNQQTERDVEQVVQVANLWLDQITDLPAPESAGRALTRTAWVEQTLPVWHQITEPVATGVSNALGAAMREQMSQFGDSQDADIPGLPPGLNPAAILGQMEPMIERMSSTMFGAQLGQAVGALAGETVSATEVGLPLLDSHTIALIPANVRTFAEGLAVEPGEVHLYLAVREAARVRLHAGVPWLGPQLLAAVQDYARDITINTEAIEEAVRDADPSDPQALQESLADSLFHPEPSAAQRQALTRLETYLALVEGWVDLVTERATETHLPHHSALAEAVRRRRATGGPAEKLFAGLVGLELRPRRLRDAANLWAAVESSHGAQARDNAWAHPDLAPTAADLDDPLGYAERVGNSGDSEIDAFDAALDQLLRGEDGTGRP